MIKACILDFDGVILESVDIKGEVFRTLFHARTKHLKEILEYHYANGGVSRFEKFRYIYRHILQEPLSDEKFQGLCDEFAKLAFQKVVEAPFVLGAKEFIETNYLKYDLYIVSGTPDEEIKRIVEAKGLQKFFKGVYGSPTSKIHWTRSIMMDKKYTAGEVFWIGDALSDLEAARDSGIIFLARIPETDAKNIFDGKNVRYSMKDLQALGQMIEQLEKGII